MTGRRARGEDDMPLCHPACGWGHHLPAPIFANDFLNCISHARTSIGSSSGLAAPTSEGWILRLHETHRRSDLRPNSISRPTEPMWKCGVMVDQTLMDRLASDQLRIRPQRCASREETRLRYTQSQCRHLRTRQRLLVREPQPTPARQRKGPRHTPSTPASHTAFEM